MNELILTICMANYNHAQYLPKRISSLLEAMPENSEFLIVDDGSTDTSITIIDAFAKYDKRIIFIKNQRNLGVIASIQKTLEIAKGKYICFLAADDFVLPHFFFTILKFADDYPGFAVYCSHYGHCFDTIPENLSEIHSHPLMEGVDGIQLFPAHLINQIFFKIDFWIPVHAAIISREWVMKLGGFNPRLSHYTDWFLIHASALMGGVAYLPETLSVWRLASDSFTSREMSKKTALFNIEMNFFKILDENRELRRRFRNSTVLRGIIRKRLFPLCLRPKYWDFLFLYTLGFFVRRIRKILGIKLNFKK